MSNQWWILFILAFLLCLAGVVIAAVLGTDTTRTQQEQDAALGCGIVLAIFSGLAAIWLFTHRS